MGHTDGAVERGGIAAGDARVAVLRRWFAAPLDVVWEACTDPERLNRWFIKPTGDLRAGGTFSLEGNASGEIVRCERPTLLVLTWIYGDRPADEVTLRLLAAEDGGTLLQLEHATVGTQVEWDGQWHDVIPGVGSGWESALRYLDRRLLGQVPDAPTSEWYQPSPQDADLASRSAELWTTAAATAGALASRPSS
jgi:uncharacterized protein YndB with AHSA1/START domain